MCRTERSSTLLPQDHADGARPAAIDVLDGVGESPDAQISAFASARPARFGAYPLQEIWLIPRNIAITVMHLYRRTISPLYGQVCRYYPSCSRYAVDAFQRQGFLAGIGLTAWRLLRCNPFTPGGIDDAPVRRRFRYAVDSRGFVRPVDRKA